MTERADARLAFGTCALGTDSEFPSVIDLGNTTAGSLGVGIHVKEKAAGGTSLTVTVEGSDDGTAYKAVSKVTFLPADLDGTEELYAGIPRGNKSRYLKLTLDKAGTFTAGALEAWIDTYTGK